MVEQTVRELLEGHVVLDVEGIDRLYLNLYQPMLQTGGGVATFFKVHRGAKVASTTLMAPMSHAFVKAIHDFARLEGVETVAFAKEHGYLQTLFGRKIHTPEINAKGPGAGFAQRAAINAPIQGTAADIIRRAMIRMDDATRDLPARMLLQVHDELVFEVAEDSVDALIARARAVMEGAALPAVHLDVPIIVDAGQGANWAVAH